MSPPLKIGFVALNDAAVLIAAQARGLFAAEGLSVELVREVSWATIRDKVNVGALDAAHMLAPLALATSVGAAGAQAVPLIAPFALALNGPAITLSSRLPLGPGRDADGLARLVARRWEEGASPITLAVVFPFSTHAYLLRDWLARSTVLREARSALAFSRSWRRPFISWNRLMATSRTERTRVADSPSTT